MRIYLAGKIENDLRSIANFSEELEDRGHKILEKWFLKGRLPKPYLDNLETSSPAAEAMINAAFESEVFVLFPSDNVLGAATELGAALCSKIYDKEKHIIIVGASIVRQSVFYAHPEVVHVNDHDQIRNMEWY
jgi:hypothetical protein